MRRTRAANDSKTSGIAQAPAPRDLHTLGIRRARATSDLHTLGIRRGLAPGLIGVRPDGGIASPRIGLFTKVVLGSGPAREPR